MLILAIDPGHLESGWMLYDGATKKPIEFGIDHNQEILNWIESRKYTADAIVQEVIGYMGMSVGREVFETCEWVGQFTHAGRKSGYAIGRLTRVEAKVAICGSAKAKDPNVRQALIDRWGGDGKAIGGVKCRVCKGRKVIGRAKTVCLDCAGSGWREPPGPLHEVTAHVWSALAVAVAWTELQATKGATAA